jgi:hypothetical protein
VGGFAMRFTLCGAKGGDQEECEPAKHVRDAGPDKRDKGVTINGLVILTEAPPWRLGP